MTIETTTTTDESTENGSITAQHIIAVNARIRALPKHFSTLGVVLEQTVYQFADQLIEGYTGGFWEYYHLSNGGFFMVPDDEGHVRVSSPNEFSDELSVEAAGIVCCLFAYSHLAFNAKHEDIMSEHYHWLREFAFLHSEAALIFRAID